MSENTESRDQLTPKDVHDQIKAHDKRMRDGQKDWTLFKKTYLTQYWEHVNGNIHPNNPRVTELDVEVNRLWGVMSTYLSALYPRASRAVLTPDASGQGDAYKSEMAVNRWLSSRRVHHRVMTGLRQALLYPGSGIKLGYNPGRGNPLDRIWMRVIPWWEMVLDHDVGDREDERFRGHIYYRPKVEVEQEYGLEDLAGTQRVDFLSNQSTVAESKRTRRGNDVATGDESAFVRVLELCNLTDTIADKDDPSIVYQGRLEIYVLGQGGKSKEPVYIGPLPFAENDGTPMSHIMPLIFNHEPEFPLRGIAHTKRLMPQIRELNAYRSYMAMATRKDTRQYVTRKGTFSAEEMTNLTEGHDGLVLEVESGFERPLGDAIIPIVNAPISSGISQYVANAEMDLERVIGTSPQARGQITKATAFEVQTVTQYTESEFGMHASIKDQWLANMVALLLRALIASMQDSGDSAGAFEEQHVDLAKVGARSDGEADTEREEEATEPEPWTVERIKALAKEAGADIESEEFQEISEQVTKKRHLDDMDESELAALGAAISGTEMDKKKVADEEEEAQVEEALVQGIASNQEPYVDEDVVRPLGIERGEGYAELHQEALTLKDRSEHIVVTAEDLDAKFEITFVEGGRTPLTDAAMQQNLVALMEPYSALWQQAQDPSPMGAFARSYMKVMAERFDLPKDLHPDELDAKFTEMQEAEAEEKKRAPKEEQMAPGDEPPVDPGDEQMAQEIAQVAQLPPDQAIMALKQMFANDPNMQQMLDQISGLPPEQQAQMLQQIVGAAGAPV